MKKSAYILLATLSTFAFVVTSVFASSSTCPAGVTCSYDTNIYAGPTPTPVPQISPIDAYNSNPSSFHKVEKMYEDEQLIRLIAYYQLRCKYINVIASTDMQVAVYVSDCTI